MTKTPEINFVVLAASLAGVLAIGSSAMADDSLVHIHKLRALESIPPGQRILAREQINVFLEKHPNIEVSKYQFAVAKNGDIYVLDKNQDNQHSSRDPVAQPSCIE